MSTNEYLINILNAIIYRAELFLRDEMKIEVYFDGNYRFVEKIELKKYTTMIGIGGTLNLMFYTTYEEVLLNTLTKQFAYGTINEDEVFQFRESAAGEIANTILGISLNDFPNKGRGVTMTPPVTIEDAKSILKTNGTGMITAQLLTLHGHMEFNLIGSLHGDEDA